MAKIPQIDALQQFFEGGLLDNEHRPHLGYSELGDSCLRYLYYKWRWTFTEKITRRQMRIFNRGDIEEPRIEAEFKRLGLTLTNKQVELVGPHGHILGHTDGEVTDLPESLVQIFDPGYKAGDPVLAEIKTMNEKRFNHYNKVGLKKSDPKYYSQINSYMGKRGIKWCLMIVHNKNTEERSYRLIPFDKDEFERIENRGYKVLFAEELPLKIGDATWWECKFCSAKGVCHHGEPIDKNCRTCEHAAIAEGGKWECAHDQWHIIADEIGHEAYSNTLSVKEQQDGCRLYELDEFFK